VLDAGGLVHHADSIPAADRYSYIFDGAAGNLDHMLSTASLATQVTSAAYWHINSDEPPVLDYNVEYKSENHVVTLYAPDPFRSSDHDPVLVGLALGGEAGGGDKRGGKSDGTPGLIAIIAGVVAVLLAMVLGALGARRKG